MGSNHKSFAVHSNEGSLERCLQRHRDKHIHWRKIVMVIRNPLGLKSEMREKYKKIKMSKTVDFLRNPR